MARRKIHARKLINERDFLHLAKEFYRYIYRFPDVEADNKWKEIKIFAEDFIVTSHCKQENSADFSSEDFRDFLRFYTNLETRHYDEEREFIFSEADMDYFFSLQSKSEP